MEMTASGPFAMGPANAGQSGAFRRAPPRSNFASAIPTGSKAELGAGLSAVPAPSLLRRENVLRPAEVKGEDEEDGYSDPDEGVEIVDLAQVRELDWMAPESLKKEKERKKLKKQEKAIEGTFCTSIIIPFPERSAAGEVDLANAIDLSESEEEEELEDIIDDFEMKVDLDEVCAHLSVFHSFYFILILAGPNNEAGSPVFLPVPRSISQLSVPSARARSKKRRRTFLPEQKSDFCS